ncbi:Vacuolar basic amino acid transporter 1 [Wickerhamomyces ciferrii]|uniref:Vacuolar basic amino acid transporter 1 n=1 Tax=Wickerhamomyces ciferrii (strain ATCC 14091 / BCRC 22168 / CBS 111 / JCM 3599 / NBRC 0793 / NRRL Y-1031 F-60-10) TaxID=1206466 RepID=K0KNF0_WICCF|nr:Vacuolar basic amino acid transporter 1 [Wickerhamomyces ciferrii]CCH44521.1 Vacuolar basic amino acid transporter 1 [Wickerhamomyces ciferrii]
MPPIELHELSQSPKRKNHDLNTTTTILTTPSSRDSNESSRSNGSLIDDLIDEEEQVGDLSRPGPDLTAPIKPFIADSNFKYTLTAVWVGNFLCALDGTIVSTTMSNIASDFGQSNLVSWIAVSYLLTSTAFQPLYGKTSDILGRKTLLLIGQALFGIGIFLSGISTNVETLSLSRALSGIGGSGIFTLSSIVISDVVPLTQRSMYAAYGTVIVNTSQMLGGPLGGFCIATIGWRWMFLIQVPFIIGCMVITYFCEIKVAHIPDGPERFSKENIKRIDFGGILTSNLFVSSIIFLLSDNGGYPKPFEYFLYALLIISLVGYVIVEKYIAVEKLVDPQLMKGQIGVLGLVNGINSLSFYLILFIVPLYLQLIQHITVTHIGFYTMFCVVSSAIGAMIGGSVIKRYNQTEASTMKAGISVSAISFMIQTIGFSMLYMLSSLVNPVNESLFWRIIMILSLTISGLGVGGFGPGVALFIIGKSGAKDQASTQTAVNVIKSLGNVLGLSLSLSVYNKEVQRKLWDFFGEGKKDIIDHLIKDSSYIFDELDQQYFKDVLNIYRDSLSKSYQPIFIMTIFGLSIIYLLNRNVQKGLKL